MNDRVKYGFIDRTGEIHTTNEGFSIEIIEYISYDNCTVRFEDGTILIKRFYGNIIKGKVRKPKEDINPIGKEYITKQGYKIKITEYFNNKNCTVLFENGLVLKKKTYLSVVSGTILNPYHPTVYGIGYIGIGKCVTQINNVRSKIYYAWKNILERCYSEKLHKRKPTYKEITICDEWCNFQVFSKWYEENYIKGFQLDKDILVKGNKVYSPETCCFVPSEINNLFTNRKNNRGLLPVGVRKYKDTYRAKLRLNNTQTELKTVFITPEEAFYAYKVAKEREIKRMADKWKEQITTLCYEAMYAYQVEIND